MPRSLSRPSWVAIGVLTVGLVVRLAIATTLVPMLEGGTRVVPDPDHYAELAAGLIDRGELGFDPPGASPTSLRGPAFPAWLALGMVLGGRAFGWIAFWASLPGLFAATAIATLLSRSHGRWAGLVGGLLAAAHPLACFVSARVLPDEFYGAALFFGLITWRIARRPGGGEHRLGWAALAGIALAVASVTRVTAVGVLLVVAADGFRGERPQRKASAVIVLVAAALLGGWAFRTSALVGRPAFVESLAGYNFWLGESADRYGFASGFGESRARAHRLIAEEAGVDEVLAPTFRHALLTPMEARTFDARLVDAGLTRIRQHPLTYAKRTVAGLLWFWIRAESRQRTVQYALVALPLLALSLAGLATLMGRPRDEALPAGILVFAVLTHLMSYAAVCPMARYSVQLYPLLCYAAGAAFSGFPRVLRMSNPFRTNRLPEGNSERVSIVSDVRQVSRSRGGRWNTLRKPKGAPPSAVTSRD